MPEVTTARRPQVQAESPRTDSSAPLHPASPSHAEAVAAFDALPAGQSSRRRSVLRTSMPCSAHHVRAHEVKCLARRVTAEAMRKASARSLTLCVRKLASAAAAQAARETVADAVSWAASDAAVVTVKQGAAAGARESVLELLPTVTMAIAASHAQSVVCARAEHFAAQGCPVEQGSGLTVSVAGAVAGCEAPPVSVSSALTHSPSSEAAADLSSPGLETFTISMTPPSPSSSAAGAARCATAPSPSITAVPLRALAPPTTGTADGSLAAAAAVRKSFSTVSVAGKGVLRLKTCSQLPNPAAAVVDAPRSGTVRKELTLQSAEGPTFPAAAEDTVHVRFAPPLPASSSHAALPSTSGVASSAHGAAGPAEVAAPASVIPFGLAAPQVSSLAQCTAAVARPPWLFSASTPANAAASTGAMAGAGARAIAGAGAGAGAGVAADEAAAVNADAGTDTGAASDQLSLPLDCSVPAPQFGGGAAVRTRSTLVVSTSPTSPPFSKLADDASSAGADDAGATSNNDALATLTAHKASRRTGGSSAAAAAAFNLLHWVDAHTRPNTRQAKSPAKRVLHLDGVWEVSVAATAASSPSTNTGSGARAPHTRPVVPRRVNSSTEPAAFSLRTDVRAQQRHAALMAAAVASLDSPTTSSPSRSRRGNGRVHRKS